ncbi:MAG TPA: shikimate kinase, partial [Candidatus Limnocylindrales bacterium]|nr:shikimate kinase [Candidatus Limnocylindrales bacterium]
TVGREIERRTGWPYVDNDTLVRDLTGREPAEIRAADGEDVLHLAESHAFDTAFDLEPPVVIGVAAAIVTDPAAREALREGGHVVWLRARPETLLERVGSGAGRCAEATDPARMRRRARERELLYAAVAHETVDVDDVSPAQAATAILDGLPEVSA